MTQNNRSIVKGISTGLFVTGIAVLAYGATAFWLLQSLPPNGGASGRLPSLYVMGIGIVATLLGLAIRELRLGKRRSDSSAAPAKDIPTIWGMIILAAIIVIFFVVVLQL